MNLAHMGRLAQRMACSLPHQGAVGRLSPTPPASRGSCLDGCGPLPNATRSDKVGCSRELSVAQVHDLFLLKLQRGSKTLSCRCKRPRDAEPTPLDAANRELRQLSETVFAALEAAGQLPSFLPLQEPERECTMRNSTGHWQAEVWTSRRASR